MRPIFCFVFLTIVILSGSAFAQDEALSDYRNGKMVEMSHLLSMDEMDKCSDQSTKRYGGTVSMVQFSSGKQIANFTLRTARGNVKIHLSPELYDARISKQDAGALPTLIAKGRRITVDTYRCGGTGKTITALYILAGIHTDVLG